VSLALPLPRTFHVGRKGVTGMKRITDILIAMRAHSRSFPFATNLSLISIPIGALALVIGPEVSRGFVNVFAGRPEVIYAWGAVLLLGGCYVAVGIGRKPSRERAGLYVLAMAYSFYGVSVIVGLGFGGLVTGPTFIALSLSCVQRAHNILVTARAMAVLAASAGGEDAGPPPPITLNVSVGNSADPREVGRKTVAAVEALRQRDGYAGD
jgi:hypothetical protein